MIWRGGEGVVGITTCTLFNLTMYTAKNKVIYLNWAAHFRPHLEIFVPS